MELNSKIVRRLFFIGAVNDGARGNWERGNWERGNWEKERKLATTKCCAPQPQRTAARFPARGLHSSLREILQQRTAARFKLTISCNEQTNNTFTKSKEFSLTTRREPRGSFQRTIPTKLKNTCSANKNFHCCSSLPQRTTARLRNSELLRNSATTKCRALPSAWPPC